jgi:ADP-heptose:LPS heptosyltransferase
MKILIVQIGRIGDMVLTTPMFGALREVDAQCRIHLLSSAAAAPVIMNHPLVERIILFRKNIFSLPLLLHTLRSERYDVWVDPKDHYSSRQSFLARHSRAAKKIGFNPEGKRIFNIGIESDLENSSLHAITRNLRSLSSLGVIVTGKERPELYVGEYFQRKIDQLLAPMGRKIAVCNISAGNVSRRWPEQSWVGVAGYCQKLGYDVFVICHPDDRTRADEIMRRCSGVTVFDSPSIREVIALIARSHLVVTPDTSVVHIASAFNVPLVGLYPDVEWNYHKFRPLSNVAGVVMPEKGQSFLSISPGRVMEEITLCSNASGN